MDNICRDRRAIIAFCEIGILTPPRPVSCFFESATSSLCQKYFDEIMIPRNHIFEQMIRGTIGTESRPQLPGLKNYVNLTLNFFQPLLYMSHFFLG